MEPTLDNSRVLHVSLFCGGDPGPGRGECGEIVGQLAQSGGSTNADAHLYTALNWQVKDPVLIKHRSEVDRVAGYILRDGFRHRERVRCYFIITENTCRANPPS